MLNEYVFGDYLIWALPEEKVFIDGNAATSSIGPVSYRNTGDGRRCKRTLESCWTSTRSGSV